MSTRFRLRAPAITENHVETAAVSLLRYRRYKVERLHNGLYRPYNGRGVVQMGEPGRPDYICAHAIHGAFYMECKRPDGGELSSEQARWIERAQRGWDLPTAVISNTEELIEWLFQFERRAMG